MLPVSALSSYSYCKRKFYLQYGLKLYVPIKKAVLVRGTIRHAIEEDGNKGQEGIVCGITHNTLGLLEERMKQLYSKVFEDVLKRHASEITESEVDLDELREKVLPSVLNSLRYRVAQIISFAQEHHLEGKELWDRLIPKIQNEVRVSSNGIGIRGIVDQIEDFKTHLLPVELKTGSLPPSGVWPGHKIQLACYMMMLNEHLGKNIKRGVVRYLDHDVEREVVMNPFLEMEIREMVKELERVKGTPTLPGLTENRKKCESCQYKEHCYSESIMQDLMKKKWGSQHQEKRGGKNSTLSAFF